jgi:hypothetical protein
MKTSEFKSLLQRFPNSELCFELPDGGRVAAHAHITEAGRVDKTFIDCGGTIRKVSTASLQAWVADDIDHRLPAGKLADVLDIAAPVFNGDDLDLEIEYEDGFISQFPVTSMNASEDVLYIHLGTKHTDCLAKDVCLAEPSGCCGGGGC